MPAHHPYYTPANGWQFLCYVNTLRFLPEGEGLTLLCATVSPEAMRQRFINGRFYIANAADDSPLAKYHSLTAATKVSINKEHSIITLKPTPNFEEVYTSLKLDPLLQLLAEIHLFIYDGSAGSLFRRFDFAAPGLTAGLTNFADRIYKPHVDLFSITHESILFRKSRAGRPPESLISRGYSRLA